LRFLSGEYLTLFEEKTDLLAGRYVVEPADEGAPALSELGRNIRGGRRLPSHCDVIVT
jgi:hypothetical protein